MKYIYSYGFFLGLEERLGSDNKFVKLPLIPFYFSKMIKYIDLLKLNK